MPASNQVHDDRAGIPDIMNLLDSGFRRNETKT
jgi:hypothetical protein